MASLAVLVSGPRLASREKLMEGGHCCRGGYIEYIHCIIIMFTLSTVSCGGTGLEEDTLLVDLLKCEMSIKYNHLDLYKTIVMMVYCFYTYYIMIQINDLESKNNM